MPITVARLSLSELTRFSGLDIKPVATDGAGAPPPENSEIKKIAADVLGAAKMSFVAVAANPDVAARKDTLEDVFKQAIKAMPAAKRTRDVALAKNLAQVSPESRKALFGTAGERDFDSHLAAGGFDRYDEGLPPLAIDRKLLGIRDTVRVPRTLLRPVADGLLIPGGSIPGGLENFESNFESAADKAEETGVVAEDTLMDIWESHTLGDPYVNATGGSEFEEFAVTDKMGFWITKIKCVDETNPEFWGHDEIALAGVSVDEDGDTKRISEKYIGGGFDDGDSKSYSNWRYHWFSLQEGQYWPKTYSVSLILAEKDNGGLSSFLNSVWAKIKDKVKEAIAKAVAAGLTPYVGAAIAAAIGKAVAWVVDIFVQWIIDWWKDDIFPVFRAHVTTPSMTARWHYANGNWGNPSSGIRKAHFWGHGGHYDISYYWKFYS